MLCPVCILEFRKQWPKKIYYQNLLKIIKKTRESVTFKTKILKAQAATKIPTFYELKFFKMESKLWLYIKIHKGIAKQIKEKLY